MATKGKGVPTTGPRLQKWLSNPGLRSKLPDTSLPKEQLAKRRANRAMAVNNATIYNPLAQLAGSSLRQAADAQVGLQYDPQESALDTQKSDILASQKQVSQYATQGYNQAGDRIQALLASAPRDRADAVNAQLQASDQTASAINANQTAALQRIATDSTQRGINVPTQMTAEIQAQNDRASAAANGQLANTNKVYDASTELARETGVAAQQAGTEFQADLHNSTEKRLLENDTAHRQLIGERGAARIDALTKLRQEQFNNFATGQGLDIKSDALQQASDIANMRDQTTRHGQAVTAATQRRGQDVSASTTKRGQDISNANADADRAQRGQNINWAHHDRIAALRAKGQATPAQVAKQVKENVAIQGTLKTATSQIAQYINKPIDPTDPKSGTYTPDVLVNKIADQYFHGDHDMALVAYWYQKSGYVGPNGRRILTQHGVPVPTDWKQK